MLNEDDADGDKEQEGERARGGERSGRGDERTRPNIVQQPQVELYFLVNAGSGVWSLGLVVSMHDKVQS